MKKLSIFVLASLILLSLNAQAKPVSEIDEVFECQQKHKNRMDYSVCLDNALNKLDREMTTWETNLEFKLRELSKATGRGDVLMVFKKSKDQFQKFRKVNCQWQYLAMLPDVGAAAAMVKECKIQMVDDRITKLSVLSDMEF